MMNNNNTKQEKESTSSHLPKMRVKLKENNELKFMLSIKGSTSDPSATQPLVRFMVEDPSSGISMCFPMEKLEEGMVGVLIPDSIDVFKEDREYIGKVEVIVGNRYFTPTQVGLVFERELEIEASPVVTSSAKHLLEREEEPEGSSSDEENDSLFSTVIRPQIKQKEVPEGITTSSSWKKSIGEETVQQAIFSELKKKHKDKPITTTSLPPSISSSTALQPSVSTRKQKMKSKIKSMLVEAWAELEE